MPVTISSQNLSKNYYSYEGIKMLDKPVLNCAMFDPLTGKIDAPYRKCSWMPVENNRGNICLVEDDAVVRKALAILLQQQGFSVQEFTTGEQFLDAIGAIPCACILLDIHLPDISGLDILARLGTHWPDKKVIIITGQGDVPTAVKAMQLGAIDFIEKPPTVARLRDAIDRALTTQAEDADTHAGAQDGLRPPLDELSPREVQVLTLLVNGHQHKVIAHELGISHRTVEVHKARIMKRLGVRSFAELVRIAVLSGMHVE